MRRWTTGGALLRVMLGLALLAALLAGWQWQRYQHFATTPLEGIAAGDSLVLARGDGLGNMLRKLDAEGIDTGSALYWRLLARQTGAAGRLQAGEYALAEDTSPRALLLALRDGKVMRRKFTIIEGWNIRDLRAALAKVPQLRQELPGLDDAALMRALGAPGQHPEGRFLPETYFWARGEADLDILRQAHAAMARALDAAWKTRAAGLPLRSKDEALILASVVEKETGIAEERPEIAGVFVRRLQIGMRLQTDPTVIYGMGTRYAGNIRRSDLTTDTPYNTYTRAGLPPTPIAMPGKDALQAATHPAAGDALYFVAIGDGSGRHVFSASLGGHNSAVRDYLQRLRAQRASAGKP